jgi:acetoin utilization protein AcuB
MTPSPATVPPDATVAAALAAMRRGRFRHLPVVAGGELLGVVAHGDLESPPGTPVEAAESLGDRPVAEVMSGQPVTVWPDEPVEVAARLLHEHAIGCLPVVSDDRLVGILTESDLFAVLLRLLGGDEPSSRITLVLPDVPGALGRAMAVVGELGVNLVSVVTEPGPEPGTRGVVLRAGTINAAPVVAALVAAGVQASGPGQPGPTATGAGPAAGGRPGPRPQRPRPGPPDR